MSRHSFLEELQLIHFLNDSPIILYVEHLTKTSVDTTINYRILEYSLCSGTAMFLVEIKIGCLTM